MLRYLFDRPRRTAARELEVALYFLLHDSEKLVPLLKKTYRKQWSGFIEDILKGARPYEEAIALISIFLQHSVQNLTAEAKTKIASDVATSNIDNPANVLRIVSQVAYFLYLAEQEGHVREKCWTIWISDMASFLSRNSDLLEDSCSKYFLTFANSYRSAKQQQIRAQE